MKEPPCRHPHGGSFINTIRKTLRPPQTLPADGKTGKQVILPISRPPACHAGSESRAGKESPVYKPAIPVHLPPENGDARHHTGPAQTGSGHRQSFRKMRRNPPCAPSGQAPEYGHRHPGGSRLPPFPPPSGLQPDNRKRRQIKRSYPVFLMPPQPLAHRTIPVGTAPEEPFFPKTAGAKDRTAPSHLPCRIFWITGGISVFGCFWKQDKCPGSSTRQESSLHISARSAVTSTVYPQPERREDAA